MFSQRVLNDWLKRTLLGYTKWVFFLFLFLLMLQAEQTTKAKRASDFIESQSIQRMSVGTSSGSQAKEKWTIYGEGPG